MRTLFVVIFAALVTTMVVNCSAWAPSRAPQSLEPGSAEVRSASLTTLLPDSVWCSTKQRVLADGFSSIQSKLAELRSDGTLLVRSTVIVSEKSETEVSEYNWKLDKHQNFLLSDDGVSWTSYRLLLSAHSGGELAIDINHELWTKCDARSARIN